MLQIDTSVAGSSLAQRRLAARPLPLLPIPAHDKNADDDSLITPAISHFPLVCPPAPAPPTITYHNRRIPTIILPDLTELVPSPDTNMKAQSTTSAQGARYSAIYPPSKRTSIGSSTSTYRPTVAVSPSSLNASSVSKRRSPRTQVPQRSYSSSSATSYAPSYPSRSSYPRPASSRSVSQKSQLALQHHQRAVFAQRAAARYNEINSLDRGIRMLLEEEYREDIKAWMLEKEVRDFELNCIS